MTSIHRPSRFHDVKWRPLAPEGAAMIGETVLEGLGVAAEMAWETWWALVSGFTISGAGGAVRQRGADVRRPLR